jgi:hypothetical protein
MYGCLFATTYLELDLLLYFQLRLARPDLTGVNLFTEAKKSLATERTVWSIDFLRPAVAFFVLKVTLIITIN